MPTLSQEILEYIILGLCLSVFILLILVIELEVRLKKITNARNKSNPEFLIKTVEEHLKTFDQFQGDMKGYLSHLDARLKKSVRGVATVSFSAFQGLDSGGTNSFATAFVNEEGAGLVLSTLHARDRVNVFAKEVKNFTCELSLTEEEQDALTQAIQSCKL